MKIAAGWDHRGWMFRERLERAVRLLGHEFVAMGATTAESSDYPDFAFRVAEAVSRGEVDRGVLVCGTGIGMSIAANKISCVRAALAHDRTTARLAREHNDANVLTLGARVISEAQALEVVQEFLAGEYAGGRHQARIDKITQIDKERNRKA